MPSPLAVDVMEIVVFTARRWRGCSVVAGPNRTRGGCCSARSGLIPSGSSPAGIVRATAPRLIAMVSSGSWHRRPCGGLRRGLPIYPGSAVRTKATPNQRVQRHITNEDTTQRRLPKLIPSQIPRAHPTNEVAPATAAIDDAHTGVTR